MIAQPYDVVEIADAGVPTRSGTLKVVRDVHSPELSNSRDILVHLPTSYTEDQRRYPVIYMHDGQNLFDDATSFAGAWHVDEALEALDCEGLDAIVVGIPNLGPKRIDEYSPFVDAARRGGSGDRYLRFIIQTLKPLIDREFRTLPDRLHTGVVGSSMGGLISLYAFFRHPDVFGFAGAMSPSLWFANGAIFRTIDELQPLPGRVYLDAGTGEGPGLLADVRRLRNRLQGKRYQPGLDLRYVEEEGAGHSEAAWGGRLCDALRFLIGRAVPADEQEPGKPGIPAPAAAAQAELPHVARIAGRESPPHELGDLRPAGTLGHLTSRVSRNQA